MFHRPGQYVNEVLLASATPINPSTAVAAFLGASPRGPIVPTEVTSWNQFTAMFGNFTGIASQDVLATAVYTAFLNGARDCYVCRAVGSGATAAHRTFLDNAGTPVMAIDLTAKNPGKWAGGSGATSAVYVEITDGSDATNLFSITIRLVPTSAAITNAQIVERQWTDLSLDPTNPRYILSVLNDPFTGSNYVTAALHSAYAYASPARLASSVTAGGDPLASGVDGSAPSSANLLSALDLFDSVAQPFVLNLPGITDATTINGAIAYADPDLARDDSLPGRGDVFVVVDSVAGSTESAAITLAATYTPSSYRAVYYPQVVISDPSNTQRSATKLVPQGGVVVGEYMQNDSIRGVYRAPAGTSLPLKGVLALDPAATLRNPQLDALNDANVNALRVLPNIGPVIYGVRTGKNNYADHYINVRRLLINIKSSLLAQTQFAIFENNDQYLWNQLSTVADKFLRDLFAQGALKGTTADQAYYVLCDSTNNPQSEIDAGATHLEVGVALEKPTEFLVIQIGQYAGGTGTATEQAAA